MFGEVAEGLDVLEKLNLLFCDEEGRPYQDVRIKHKHILDDPFPAPPELEIPEERIPARIPYEQNQDETEVRNEEELKRSLVKGDSLRNDW